VERRKEEVSGGVAREDASRAVPAVRRRRQANDQDASAGIAERRDGARPVRLAGEPPGRAPRGFLAPGDQTGALRAADDLSLDPVQGVHDSR
jgi:hypothetical protein